MNDLDCELTKVFGVANNWSAYIRRVATRMAVRFCRNAILDDMVTTIITEIYFNAQQGKLCEALMRAKDASHNTDELLSNVQGVVTQATKYRISHERRQVEHNIFFMPMDDMTELCEHEETSLTHYVTMIVEELKTMAETAKQVPNLRLANRYLLAAKVAPDRINGGKSRELMRVHSIGSSATWRRLMLDIGQAIVVVGERTENPWLCQIANKELEKSLVVSNAN